MENGGKVGVGARVLQVTPSFALPWNCYLGGKKNTYTAIVYIYDDFILTHPKI
jgi:hypothetical protein